MTEEGRLPPCNFAATTTHMRSFKAPWLLPKIGRPFRCRFLACGPIPAQPASDDFADGANLASLHSHRNLDDNLCKAN